MRVTFDLCSWADIVVIGTISSEQAKRRDTETDRGIYRITQLRIERVVQGPPLHTLDFIVEGGTLDGVSGFVGGEMKSGVGKRYLLFLTDLASDGTAMRVGRRALNPNSLLPDELLLRHAWDTACADHPEGIPPVGPRLGTWPRTAVGQLEPTPNPPVQTNAALADVSSVLPLEPCPAKLFSSSFYDLEQGLCLRGHEDEPVDGWR